MPLTRYEKFGPVGRISLHNPDNLNAMSVEMGKDFQGLLNHIKKDRTTRVVILTGTGRAFSSGGNLEMILGLIGKKIITNQSTLKKFYQLYLGVRDLPQPVIAAINGPAIGAGFCLALACDLRFAATEAKMGANFARLGLAPGMAGTSLITGISGPTFASEMLLTGRIYSAPEVLRFGLLNGVVPAKDLLAHVHNIAVEIAANAPLALSHIKRGIQLAQHKTLEQMFDYDAHSQALCFKSSDLKEGVEAMLAKRPPRFKGR